ncbi:MAG: hypothetical protein F6J96_16140 [Symploca sp. SIO1C2]|nr:hypothetical protein [Symploca sp. SIO1C2]
MLHNSSSMSEYQWKLTIVERNLLLANWRKLMPEAQERMLQEAEELMQDLPLADREGLLISLETLQCHTQGVLQQMIQQILSSQLSLMDNKFSLYDNRQVLVTS